LLNTAAIASGFRVIAPTYMYRSKIFLCGTSTPRPASTAARRLNVDGVLEVSPARWNVLDGLGKPCR